ncbi:uncharacterized protein LOC110501220 isoform X1 [Oncorhynchus mykiss]|uniref:uncharacterized protein LOC110501220 isoform X1 n=1 Tax=Oncorhynchus mykiss TaxID=8022 RepID=UPI00187789DF|nr:uncharacterized protein LOC110501220 isoform X1 [Oncorhynchus mykiss]
MADYKGVVFQIAKPQNGSQIYSEHTMQWFWLDSWKNLLMREVGGWPFRGDEDRETRRSQLTETAEQRQKETTSRGVKNPQAVERNKKNKEMEKQEMRPSPPGGGGGGGLKVG